MSEERQYVTNFTFPNGETFYIKDTEAREDIEELKKHGGGGSGDINVQSDWNQTDSTADDYIKNKPDIYTKNEVDQKLIGAMTYKGTKAAVSELPNSGNQQGDVWHINEDGSEWAWNGTSWEELGKDGDAVLYTSQTLTPAQQEQARENIGAGTYSKPSGGIPASDLAAGVIPTVPQMATQTDMSDWTSGKTVDAGAAATVFAAADTAMRGKLNTNQGAENAGKFMVVGNDGIVAPVAMQTWQGGSY